MQAYQSHPTTLGAYMICHNAHFLLQKSKDVLLNLLQVQTALETVHNQSE